MTFDMRWMHEINNIENVMTPMEWQKESQVFRDDFLEMISYMRICKPLWRSKVKEFRKKWTSTYQNGYRGVLDRHLKSCELLK